MPGQIKAGEGTLIGNAGEYYVAAELLKRSVIAALAPRNAPGFDILATKHEKNIKIRVKTKSEEYNDWQWMAKKDGSIFKYLPLSLDETPITDFTVLVNLTKETRNMTYYILPTFILNRWLVQDFTDWVATPGKNGHLHDPSNLKRNLSAPKFMSRLEKYRDNWDILWEH